MGILRGTADWINVIDKGIFFKVIEYDDSGDKLSGYIPYDEYIGIEDQLFADYCGFGING